MGTSLAILGAYVLAGEIIKAKDDHASALRAYEEKLRPYGGEEAEDPARRAWNRVSEKCLGGVGVELGSLGFWIGG